MNTLETPSRLLRHTLLLMPWTNSDSIRQLGGPLEALEDQFSCRRTLLSALQPVNSSGKTCIYPQGGTADFGRPLRMKKTHTGKQNKRQRVTRGTELGDMINQLKEAVGCCWDPSRVTTDQDDLSGVQLYPVEMVTVEESLNGQDSDDGATTPKRDDRSPASGHPSFSSPPFGLKPRSAPPSLPCSPPPSCLDPSLLSQASPLRRDTPRSHDDGGMHSRVFLRSHKSLESVDPQFTMRRKMEQLREELELMEQLRDSIESRLKVVLPEDLGSSLMDGVVLCHLANHIRPRSVGSIHVPSPAVPKLSMAKCRRNVENFLDACRKIGVPEDKLCLPHHILEEKGLVKVSITVQALVDEASSKHTFLT
ncbi:leucine-rich repeat and calponin homology domain-containing protein 1 isoform X1 [Lates japonicus]|uniref:Leucine-rich repeat and calponin homology domain-containing protein 1 isoform X1 n=1 Tax=Lates japonicus TaxID=270547 RepID=A0AAD3NAQ3_LATJO|nr:leucine-rich repeat and calponin homology domain-containing protein 1 isoform X1 [Lates japonicus]